MMSNNHFICQCCHNELSTNPRLGKARQQHFCGMPTCQNERKRAWDLSQKQNNAQGYKSRQKAKNAIWRKQKPANVYQKQYRETHPEYVQKNREKQILRNQKRKQRNASEKIVKTDALIGKDQFLGGLYEIRSLQLNTQQKIVKTDALLVTIQMCQGFATNIVTRPG